MSAWWYGCDHREHFRGCRDSGGYYLPGDEPGWLCRQTDNYCYEPEREDCPRWETLPAQCIHCEEQAWKLDGEEVECPRC